MDSFYASVEIAEKPNLKCNKRIIKFFHKIFKCYTKVIEPISLDEAYLDVTYSKYCNGDPSKMAMQIRNKIHNDLRITASAGIALVINTGGGNTEHRLSDAIALRRATLKNKIPYCTNMSTAKACLEAIKSLKTKKLEVTSLQDI